MCQTVFVDFFEMPMSQVFVQRERGFTNQITQFKCTLLVGHGKPSLFVYFVTFRGHDNIA